MTFAVSGQKGFGRIRWSAARGWRPDLDLCAVPLQEAVQFGSVTNPGWSAEFAKDQPERRVKKLATRVFYAAFQRGSSPRSLRNPA